MKSTYDILRDGYSSLGESRSKKETEARGRYRGGSTGVVLTSDGDMSTGYDVAGTCHRVALARSLGSPLTEVDPHDPIQIMFEGGHTNEDSWVQVLEAGLPEGYKMLREEEYPVVWETEKGTPVTGRPDIVILDDKDTPVRGLELKSVNSVWVARDVVLERRPKLVNLAQAAHYMTKLDVPYELWYTSRSLFTAEEWALPIMPKWGETGSEHLEYSLGVEIADGVYKSGKKKGQPKMKFRKIEVPKADQDLSPKELKARYGITHGRFKNIRPFHMGYELTWDHNDVLHYRPLDDPRARPVPTPITKQNIEQFYNLLDDMQETGDLGPRPIELYGNGEKKKYSPCTYCPLSTQCDMYDDGRADYDLWKTSIGIVPEGKDE